MRYFAVLVGLVPALSVAQASPEVQAWAKEHFGLQIEFPTTSSTQNYQRVAQTDGTYVYKPNGPTYLYNDPACQPWQGAYSVVDLMPTGTWIRASVNLWEHFRNHNPGPPDDYDRYQIAITGRVLFPNMPNNTDGHNILWVMVPGIPPRYSTNDGWFDYPETRDWYKPIPENRPYLHAQVQAFVTGVNNFAVDLAKPMFPGKITENIVGRMGFQLGNEIGAAHPGGSVYGPPGDWTGMGQVMEDTTNGISWRPDDNYTSSLAGGASWTNPINLPAFSFLTESRGQAFVNQTLYGQVKSIQWPGATVPGLREIYSYYDEVFGPSNNFGWAAQASRRSVHFRSPVIQWIRANDGVRVYWPDINPDLTLNGRWENAQEFAKRWVDEFALVLKGYGRLPMPSPAPTVDMTECYLTYGELNSKILSPDNYQFTVNGVPKSTDQIRADALQMGSTSVVSGQSIVAPVPPSRRELFAAIRDELYTRSVQGGLPNLGRIFWVNGYTSDPRRETGFESVDPITSYNPWADFRLSPAEITTLFGTYAGGQSTGVNLGRGGGSRGRG